MLNRLALKNALSVTQNHAMDTKTRTAHKHFHFESMNLMSGYLLGSWMLVFA